jgi:hypothetical protein
VPVGNDGIAGRSATGNGQPRAASASFDAQDQCVCVPGPCEWPWLCELPPESPPEELEALVDAAVELPESVDVFVDEPDESLDPDDDEAPSFAGVLDVPDEPDDEPRESFL